MEKKHNGWHRLEKSSGVGTTLPKIKDPPPEVEKKQESPPKPRGNPLNKQHPTLSDLKYAIDALVSRRIQ